MTKPYIFLRLLWIDILTEIVCYSWEKYSYWIIKKFAVLGQSPLNNVKAVMLDDFPSSRSRKWQKIIWHNILVERWEKGSFSSSLTWLLSFKRVFPFCALRHFRLFFYFKWPESMATKWWKGSWKKKVFPQNFFAFSSKPMIALISLTNHEVFNNQDWFEWLIM